MKDATIPVAQKEYYQKIISQLGSTLPVEILSHAVKDVCLTKEDGTPYKMCPKCNAPFTSGLCQTRLLKPPKKSSLVQALLRKQRKGKVQLSQWEKLKLSLFRLQRCTLVITCLVCQHKTKHYYKEHKKVKKGLKQQTVMGMVGHEVIGSSVEPIMPKKRKKRNKELNAGLLIDNCYPKQAEKKQKVVDVVASNALNRPLENEVNLQQNSNNNLPESGADQENQFSLTPQEDLNKRLANSIGMNKTCNVKQKLLSTGDAKHVAVGRERMMKVLKGKILRDEEVRKNNKADSLVASFLASLM